MNEMIEAGGEKIMLQEKLENKLKLPVVITRTKKVFVLDSFGKNIKVVSARGASKASYSGLRGKILHRNHQNAPIRLILKYPEVSVRAADKAIKELEPNTTKKRLIHITIDTGPLPFDWDRIEQFVTGLLDRQNNSKIVPVITIEGVLSRPNRRQMNRLVQKGIISRFVLGPALGYSEGLEGDNAGAVKAMSDNGLRVPVLFYWGGENKTIVARQFRKALRLNKLSGISILPYYQSPRFECKGQLLAPYLNNFTEVLSFLYNDRLLSEFLDEPIGDVERRLSNSPISRGIQYIVTRGGGLMRFRRFPFAGGAVETAMYGPCKRCAWRYICGGVDSSTQVPGRQYKMIADAWCSCRLSLMRRIAGECLEIREHLYKNKNQLQEMSS
jgi:hypothetical protein